MAKSRGQVFLPYMTAQARLVASRKPPHTPSPARPQIEQQRSPERMLHVPVTTANHQTENQMDPIRKWYEAPHAARQRKKLPALANHLPLGKDEQHAARESGSDYMIAQKIWKRAHAS
eukprot:4121123-Amphidinium_carterae.1